MEEFIDVGPMNQKPDSNQVEQAAHRRVAPDSCCPPSQERGRSSTLQNVIGRPLGKAVLAVCPSARKDCQNVHCHLRPLCMCAKRELDDAARKEARVWYGIAGCGALVILIALVRSLFS